MNIRLCEKQLVIVPAFTRCFLYHTCTCNNDDKLPANHIRNRRKKLGSLWVLFYCCYCGFQAFVSFLVHVYGW